tara:strand:- start:72 stop:818 length:747 start_codon:yes stop_codon:yes gene_type:complete
MCISATASINAFTINFISACLLVLFGNDNLKSINLIVALFSIFTSFNQLVDLGIWLDLDCKNGLNKTASLIGPVLIYLQPVMPFIIAFLVLNYTSDGIKMRKENLVPLEKEHKLLDMFSISSKKINLAKIINFAAIILIVILLINYYTKHVSCSQLKDGHISWNWLNKGKHLLTAFTIIYALVAPMNFLMIDPKSNYIKIILSLYILLLLVSIFVNKKYTGELWCLVSNCLPLILLVIQKIFKKELTR